MERDKFYLLAAIFCLVLTMVVGSTEGHVKAKPRKKRQEIVQSSTKTDIPTAEQILGKLLGVKPKTPEQTAASQPIATAPQSLPYIPPQPLSTSQARSPFKTIFNNIPLMPSGARGATPQTEDNPGPYAAGQQPYALPPPPNGYHYGSHRRKRPRGRYDDDEDEPRQDDGNDDEEGDDEEENPADEEYHDQRNLLGTGRGRGRGRGLGGRSQGTGRNRQEGGCGCVCWKGIKPHVEWVRVPVCYHPCGVCCPKHEDQPSCACICHPCCHQCCHCCHCCHQPCHCCHCCHCCRRSQTWRPPLAPAKRNGPKCKKQLEKKQIAPKSKRPLKKKSKRKL